MKPDFALSLSLEGIALLRRTAEGWCVVGETSLEVADLPGALENLRNQALQIDPQGLICKVVIPNDQVRYLSVPTLADESEENRQAALAALEKATPYELEELSYDLSFNSDQVHVAAVAHDTLREAEQFALEHGFEPVSFVAIPGEMSFPREPFFGVAERVKEPRVIERDDAPIRILGPVPHPRDEPVPTETAPKTVLDATSLEDPGVASINFVSRRGNADDPSSTPPLAGTFRGEELEPRPAQTVPAPIAPDAASMRKEPMAVPVEKAITGNETKAKAAPGVIPIQSPESETATGTDIDEPDRTSSPADAPTASVPRAPENETERMTIFGAREQARVGGKPRHLGLILTAGLLLFLAGVAVWAALFLEDGIAGLFKTQPAEIELAVAPTPSVPNVQTSVPTIRTESLPEIDSDLETERLEPDDSAQEFLNAGQQNAALPGTNAANEAVSENAIVDDNLSSQQQSEARYAATGIWQRAPIAPEPPEITDLNNLYEVSIDRTDLAQDAVALPPASTLDTDQPLDFITAPAAAGTTFRLDADGLVEATPEGALTPEGITVFLGSPPAVPPATPTRFEAEPDEDFARDRLATLRPRLRPGDLLEQAERAQLGGFTRDELEEIRPRERPRTVKQEAEQDETPTAQAVALSRTPKSRPRDFDTEVAKARKQSAGPSTQVAAAVVAPQTVKPSIPSSASVARRATLDNAINLRRINLIGVYGTTANRRALVRLPSGRYKKVKVGDSVDGGRIVAIGDSELRYQKGGRNVTLKMPRG